MKTYVSCIDGLWYPFMFDAYHANVLSIGNDNPENGQWWAQLSIDGIKYVSHARQSYHAAYMHAKRYGVYGGIMIVRW